MSRIEQPEAGSDVTNRTRTSGAWAAIASGLAAAIVVLVFALQNLESVGVTFLSLDLRLPLAILLLLAAVLGALIVFAFAAARIVQLRVQAHRSKPSVARRTARSAVAGG